MTISFQGHALFRMSAQLVGNRRKPQPYGCYCPGFRDTFRFAQAAEPDGTITSSAGPRDWTLADVKLYIEERISIPCLLALAALTFKGPHSAQELNAIVGAQSRGAIIGGPLSYSRKRNLRYPAYAINSSKGKQWVLDPHFKRLLAPLLLEIYREKKASA